MLILHDSDILILYNIITLAYCDASRETRDPTESGPWISFNAMKVDFNHLGAALPQHIDLGLLRDVHSRQGHVHPRHRSPLSGEIV